VRSTICINMKRLAMILALYATAVAAESKTEVLVYPCERVSAGLCEMSEAAAVKSVDEYFGSNFDGYMITNAIAYHSIVEFYLNKMSGADISAASLIAKDQGCSSKERKTLIQAGGEVRYHIPENDTGDMITITISSCEAP
jgi:hypothetical protein